MVDTKIQVVPGLAPSLRFLLQGTTWATLHNDAMEICIQDASGATVGIFNLHLSDAVRELKDMIAGATKIPPARQQLWWGGVFEALKNTKQFSAYTKQKRDDNTKCYAEYCPNTVTVLALPK